MIMNTKRILLHTEAAVHTVVTILLFGGCWYGWYQNQNGILHIAMYSILLLFCLRTYNAYALGTSRIRMLVYSQTLANIVAGGILYILMTGERQSWLHPLPMVGLWLVQLLWNTVWSGVASAMYSRLCPPARTVFLYGTQADLRYLDEVYRHTREFQVVKTMEISREEGIEQLLAGYEAVFVSGVESTIVDRILEYCIAGDIRCYVIPQVGDVILLGAAHMEAFHVPVFQVTRAKPSLTYTICKRAFDIFCALCGIIVFSPCMLLTAAAIKWYDGGPVLYKQVRLTKDRRAFTIYKFRSMRVDAEKDGVARLAAEQDDRITPVGKVIRACRFDELPQLFNILRGDMSVVGPRPERPELAAQYEQHMPAFALRLQVKAGLTGTAQVYGKYNTDPYDKLRMDLLYIQKMSWLEDIKLVFATVKILFLKESTQGVVGTQTTVETQKMESVVK